MLPKSNQKSNRPKKIKDHWFEELSAPHRGNNLPLTILGAPDDRGVLNVGGRVGASHGPSAVRKAFGELYLGRDRSIEKNSIFKGIDVETQGAGAPSLEEAHAVLRRMVTSELEAARFPVVIGGGHDYGYPHVAGAFDRFGQDLALVNVDAHLDVRPVEDGLITSGSPFYLALEKGVIKPSRFVEFGIQDHCNDFARQEYLDEKGARTITLHESRSGAGPVARFARVLDEFHKKNIRTVVSFDFDAIEMAACPGVSAPQPDGFSPREFLEMMDVAGRCPSVVTAGFFEIAPPLDENQKTVKLAAIALHRLASAVSRRGASKRPGSRRMARVRSLLNRS